MKSVIGSFDSVFGQIAFVAVRDDQGLRIQVEDEDGLCLGVLSASSRTSLSHGEFLLKEWASGEEFFDAILASDLFVDTGRRVHLGFVSAPVWAVKDPAVVPCSSRQQARLLVAH